MPDTNYQVFITRSVSSSGDIWANPSVLNENKRTDGFKINFYAYGGNISSGFGFDWIAIRPNSYTREGMVEDVLFSNTSGVNSGIINLSGNISDYDLI